jgi:hypothetical protein
MLGEFLFRSRWILRLLLVSFWEDVSLPILGEASWCGVAWRVYVGTENRFDGFRRRGRIEAVTVEAATAQTHICIYGQFWAITLYTDF